MGSHDDAHAALAQNSLDAVLPREDLPLRDTRYCVRTALRHVDLRGSASSALSALGTTLPYDAAASSSSSFPASQLNRTQSSSFFPRGRGCGDERSGYALHRKILVTGATGKVGSR